jgi:hypothetical protein
MERFWTSTGSGGRESGRLVVCPRGGDIMPGANGRSLPIGWET